MKLIIEIDDKDYEAIVEQVKKNDYPDMSTGRTIANGTPVSTDGDCISRSALRATIIEPLNANDACKNDWYEGYYTAKNEDVTTIDNAPTVDIKDQIAGAYNEGYMCGNKEAEKARPQGEWIKVKENRMSIDMSGDIVTQYRCSKCGRVIATLPSKLAEYYPFCHCGAEMKGGEDHE